MARRGTDRVGLLLLGVMAGFVLTFALVYLSVNRARHRAVEERVRVALGLPRQAFELEEVEPDGSLRILLRRVAFLDPAGDTIVSAPVARARLLAASLAGSGPIVFDQAEVVSPYLRLAQDARGEWNALQIVAAEADGQPVGVGEEARGRPLVFRGLRIVDGRARIVTPADPPAARPPARFAAGPRPEVVRSGGRWVSVHTLAGLDATLGTVRVGGGGGWRVEIERASARVTNPDTRIQALAGWFEDRGDGRIHFALQTLRTPYSAFEGEGSIATGGDAAAYDLRLRAHPLDFRDLAGMGLAVPREGTAAFALDVRTLAPGRTRLTLTDLRVAVLDSRASGRLTAVTAAGAEPVFSDTRLVLEPLRLRDLEALGFVEKSPFAGEVRGTLVSVDQLQGGRAGALRVDLTATLVPRAGGEGPASTLLARGDVRLAKAGVRFDGLRVEAEPLHLATLRPLLTGRDSLLRGTVRGGATLSGTLKDFRVEGGDLAYLVGAAPETRLRGVSGTVQLQPALRYRLEARADPLALRTLTELFPTLPFRSATLAGPIRVSGSRERMEFDVDLDGAAGALAARGALRFGAVLGFDVSGRVEAFRPGAVLAARTPAEGPLSGTFSARGTVEDLRFGVDLRQGEGSFNLAGTVRRPGGGAAQLDVEGRVDNFNVGMLVGRPGLLPGAVSGPIRITGGGRQPYRFALGLRGATGVLDVNGWYLPGTVPSYQVNGSIAGLDLSGLPGLGFLPRTRLTGNLALEGRGTTPETFVGRVELVAAAGSTVAGLPLQAGIARFSSDGAVLRVDTLLFAVRGARLEARGGLGITRPAPTPLTFALEAPDLQVVRALLPGADTLPDLSGAIAAAGSVGGTLRAPVLAATGRARAFRYGKWAAGVLDFDAQGSRSGRDWTGTAKLEGTDLRLGGQRLQALRADLDAVPGRITFGMGARRDAQTEMTAAGTLEMREGAVRGAIFDNLTLRLAGTEWKLAERARLAWAADTGLQVENLLLRRTGPGGGHLQAEGTVPPRGEADFRLNALGIDLGELHAVFPMFPDAQGVMALEATLDGPVDDPRLTLDARVDTLRFGGTVADSLHVVASYAAGRMQVAGGVRVGARQVLDATAAIPMTLTLGGIVPGFALTKDGPLTARLAADSVPLALVAAALPRYVKDGEGTARALIEVGGTPASPRVSGSAALDDGAITVLPLLARWHTMNGRLSLRGDTVRVDSLTARSGSRGRAFVNGIV
ncbi:MAG TPA: hypothetical protein VEW03_01325, partial [Longimicrobiaceae bacterium]|nr:hypothetical protein [Longimicrobiaceae bacterium]